MFDICFAPFFGNVCAGVLQERHRICAAVGTRIRDVSALIQVLARGHGVGGGQIEFVAGLLLQRARGERQRGCLDKATCFWRANDVLKCSGGVQECGAGFGGSMPLAELVLQIQLGEVAHGFKHRALLSRVNIPLVIVNDAQCGGLAAASGQRGTRTGHTNMVPKCGRDFESDQHVQRLAGDLRVHGVHVEQLRRLDGALQRGFGYFIEDDALGGGNRQAEQAARVVRNSGALAVVVRHEVRFLALRNKRPYFCNLG